MIVSIILVLTALCYFYSRSFTTVTMLQPDKGELLEKLKNGVSSYLKEDSEDTYISDILGQKEEKDDVMYFDIDFKDVKYKETIIKIRRSHVQEYYTERITGKTVLLTTDGNTIIIKESLNLVKRKFFSIFA